MNRRLELRLRNLELKCEKNILDQRHIRIVWVKAKPVRGPGNDSDPPLEASEPHAIDDEKSDDEA